MMRYRSSYPTPLGRITLASDSTALVGLWFQGQRHYPERVDQLPEQSEREEFHIARNWIEAYFAGHMPGPLPPIALHGTDFRKRVWSLLLEIPRGELVTYGQLAQKLHTQQPGRGVSAQAVGGAVGHNPLSIIVPCHRVIGADGSLTGYAGGLHRKVALLQLEGVQLEDTQLSATTSQQLPSA